MKKELTNNIFINVKYFGVIAEKTNLESEKTSFDYNQLSKIVESIKNKYDLHQLSFQISLNLNLSLSITVTLYTDDVDKPDITVSLQTYSNTSPLLKL